jgi:hypothetical protein
MRNFILDPGGVRAPCATNLYMGTADARLSAKRRPRVIGDTTDVIRALRNANVGALAPQGR